VTPHSAPFPPAPIHIENRIRRLRFERGEMTQQALADAVGVSRQTINAIEGGKYAPSLEVAFRIARALETPLDGVFVWSVKSEGGTET
jgi:putative transcriptional regulator